MKGAILDCLRDNIKVADNRNLFTNPSMGYSMGTLHMEPAGWGSFETTELGGN